MISVAGEVFKYFGLFSFIYFLTFVIFDLLNGIYIHILTRFVSSKFTKTYGAWAVVTGCTDGIGLAYARQLARRGMNVVLISRSKDKLEAVARQIERDFQVETLVVQADFSKEGRELYPRIAEQLKHLDVGILVNNVGVIPPYPLLMEEMSEEMIWEHVQCNVVAATLMTSLVLPAMKTRRRGAIVNLGSIAAAAPCPYLNMYSATKMYMAHFSRGLSAECQGSGVTVQILMPSYVNTKMVGYSSILSSGGLFVPSAETFASHAVLTLGAASETAGYLPHGIQAWFISRIPECIYVNVVRIVNRRFREEYNKSINFNKMK